MSERLYRLLGPINRQNRAFNFCLSGFILLNVFAAIIETVPSVEQAYGMVFHWFEAVSILIFSVEYVARVWVSPLDPRYQGRWGRVRYLVSPFAIIDFLAVVPSLISIIGFIDLRMLRVVRLFRLLRVLKLVRYSRAVETLHQAFKCKKPELVVTMSVGLLLILFSSTLMYLVEHSVQPNKFSSIPATMWWAISTLSTIGYGDVYPITPLGKFLGSIIAMLGVALFALPAAIMASGLNDVSQREAEEVPKNVTVLSVCPHCKAKEVQSRRPQEPAA